MNKIINKNGLSPELVRNPVVQGLKHQINSAGTQGSGVAFAPCIKKLALN